MVHPDAAPLDQMAEDFADAIASTRAHEQVVPREFEFTDQVDEEPVELEVRAFVGDKIAFGRLARFDGAEEAQALNLGIFPRLSTTLPILGVEVVTAIDGLAFLVFDLFQVASSDVSMRLDEHLRSARDELSRGFDLEEYSGWSDSVFSESAIIMQPGAGSRTRFSTIQGPLARLLDHYVDALRRYEPTVLRGLERRRRRRTDYLDALVGSEPLGALLEQLCSDEWVDHLSRECLYPEWLRAGDRIPPWLDEVDLSG